MKRFKCSLQRVLDIREAHLSKCETLLAESERALLARREDEEQCRRQMREAAEQVSRGDTRGITVQDCLAQRAWFLHLTDRAQKAGKAATKQHAKVVERRGELQQAMQHHKVIENLSRRERYDWLERLRNTEQKAMDEIASISQLRKQEEAERFDDHTERAGGWA